MFLEDLFSTKVLMKGCLRFTDRALGMHKAKKYGWATLVLNMVLSHFVLYIAHAQFNHPYVQNDFTPLGTVKHNHSQAEIRINAPQTTHIMYLSLYLPPTLLFPNGLSIFPRFIFSIFFPPAKHDFLINVHLLPELTSQRTMATLH